MRQELFAAHSRDEGYSPTCWMTMTYVDEDAAGVSCAACACACAAPPPPLPVAVLLTEQQVEHGGAYHVLVRDALRQLQAGPRDTSHSSLLSDRGHNGG